MSLCTLVQVKHTMTMISVWMRKLTLNYTLCFLNMIDSVMIVSTPVCFFPIYLVFMIVVSYSCTDKNIYSYLDWNKFMDEKTEVKLYPMLLTFSGLHNIH